MAKSALAIAAALAAASLALPATAQPDIAPLSVSGPAPTSVRLSVAGKAKAAVRDEVRVAAKTVCRNAVTNRELEMYDLGWCRENTQRKAMKRYAQIARARAFADAGTIVLSAR